MYAYVCMCAHVGMCICVFIVCTCVYVCAYMYMFLLNEIEAGEKPHTHQSPTRECGDGPQALTLSSLLSTVLPPLSS